MNQVQTIILPVLHKGQLEIAKNVFKSNCFYYIMNCSRQFGKTAMLEWFMIYHSLKDKGVKSYFISPYYSQAKKSFNSILTALTPTNLIINKSLTELQLDLNNRSILYFKGCDNQDSLRGISPNYLFIDEFAFVKQDAWRMVLKPALSVAGKRCYIASTPRTKQSDFYSMFIKGKEPNSRYLSFHMTYKDNPLANLSEVEDARQNLPEVVFNAEFEAEFINSGGEVFTNLDEASILEFNLTPLPNEQLYAGIDLGRQVDYTVLTIMDKDKNVRFIYRENQKDWSYIIKNLVYYLRQYKVKKCMVESNSVGDVVLDLLKKEAPGLIEPFWTGTNKTDLIENLAVQFQNKKIKLPKKDLYPSMYNELTTFSYIWNMKTRTLTYGAPQGLHDDCVMSLAIANETVDKYSRFSTPITYAIKNKN